VGSVASLRSRTNGHTNVQDVNFDDRRSNAASTRTSAFVTASEGRGRSVVGGGSLRSRSGSVAPSKAPSRAWMFDNMCDYQ
jgi:hypothetical protein